MGFINAFNVSKLHALSVTPSTPLYGLKAEVEASGSIGATR